MKVVGHSPVSSYPSVPKSVLLEDGPVARDGGEAVGPWTRCAPVQVQPGHWVMATGDGLVEAFPEGSETEWRASRASELVAEAAEPGADPLHRLRLLKRAAGLVGVDLSGLAALATAARSAGEPVELAVARVMRARGG